MEAYLSDNLAEPTESEDMMIKYPRLNEYKLLDPKQLGNQSRPESFTVTLLKPNFILDPLVARLNSCLFKYGTYFQLFSEFRVSRTGGIHGRRSEICSHHYSLGNCMAVYVISCRHLTCLPCFRTNRVCRRCKSRREGQHDFHEVHRPVLRKVLTSQVRLLRLRKPVIGTSRFGNGCFYITTQLRLCLNFTNEERVYIRFKNIRTKAVCLSPWFYENAICWTNQGHQLGSAETFLSVLIALFRIMVYNPEEFAVFLSKTVGFKQLNPIDQ